MDINFALPSCMSTGVCSNCGACGARDGQGIYNSEYDPAKAGNAAKLIWETGDGATFLTNGKIGMSVVVTYYIANANDKTDFRSSAIERGWANDWGFTGKISDMTLIQKNGIRSTAEHISQTTGLTLIEVQDPSAADLRWRAAEFGMTVGINPAIMSSLNPDIKNSGTVFFNTAYRNYSETVEYAPSERGFSDMLHEWGHLIGMKHGFFGNYTLTKSQDTRQTTVMSHIENPDGTFNSGLTDLDKEALRYIYGSQEQRDAKGATYVQMGFDGLLSRADDAGRVLLGLNGGKDRMIGGAGNDTIMGRAGDDVISGGRGTNVLDGGAGSDTVFWQNVSKNQITTGQVKISVWNSDVTKSRWSGTLEHANGEIDYFSNFEVIKFADAELTLMPSSPIAARTTVERLYKLAIVETKSGSGFDWHLGRLTSGIRDADSLARDFIESQWFRKPPAWDQMNTGEKIQFLWIKTYGGNSAPPELINWANKTNDFYGAVQAIISVDGGAPFTSFNVFSNFNEKKPSSYVPLGQYSERPDTAEVIKSAFALLLARQPTEVELERAIDRHDWQGISFQKIFQEVIQSQEFSSKFYARSLSPEFTQLVAMGGLDVAKIFDSTLARMVTEKFWGLPDYEDQFNLLSRNGSYGFTMASEVSPNDIVVSYKYMSEMLYVGHQNGQLRIIDNNGLEVRAPDTVKKLDFFDGSYFVGPISKLSYIKELFGLIAGSTPLSMLHGEILSISEAASNKVILNNQLLQSATFQQMFNNYFLSIPDGEKIQSLFRTFLNRDPTLEEFNLWNKYINTGGSLLEVGRAVIQGDEFAERYDASSNGLRVSDQYQAVAIKLYEVMLSRRDDWAADYLKFGFEVSDIVSGILSSSEYNTMRNRGEISNQEFATLLANGFYGHDNLDAVISAWSALLDNGTSRKDVTLAFANEFMGSVRAYSQVELSPVLSTFGSPLVAQSSSLGGATSISLSMLSEGIRIRDAGDGVLIIDSPELGTKWASNIQSLSTFDGVFDLSFGTSNLFSASVDGDNFFVLGRTYTGPVTGIERELLGSGRSEVAAGTAQGDFINLLGGDDAANGSVGNDVIDGGSGSNFLSGGAGRDIFFLDGRGGGFTWSTVTDWEAGEQLSLWGWRPGISTVRWTETDGAEGFRGATMRADLDANGTPDVAITWSGKSRAEIPTPLQFDDLLWFIG